MSRIGLLNILFGFTVILLASSAGFFLATEAEKAFLLDVKSLSSWEYTLFKSAHGHFNLFGILHILLGLTLPYSRWKAKFLLWQFGGLALGTLTMGGLLFLRASLGAVSHWQEGLGIVIGVNLSFALLAIASHCYALLLNFLRHQ